MNKSMLTKGGLQRGLRVRTRPELRAIKKALRNAKPRAGNRLQADDDSVIWDIMGQLVFPGCLAKIIENDFEKVERAQDNRATHCGEEPRAGSHLEVDDDSRIWDIMARLVFPEPVPLT